ncbi:MAG: acylphosphatase [Gemmatimonadota bacterium]|jgi:acylphosphatase
MDQTDVSERGFRIRGRVQGVGFRWWTRSMAEELGLAGSVKNLRDGTVEIRVRGSADAVRTFRGRLGKGPPGARVDDVRETSSSLPLPDGRFTIAF